MKKSTNQLAFSHMPSANGEESKGDAASTTKIEFLPCLFQNNVDESNKAIYFDSIVRDAEAQNVPQGMANLPCKCIVILTRRLVMLNSF